MNAPDEARRLFDQWKLLAYKLAHRFWTDPSFRPGFDRRGMTLDDVSQHVLMAFWSAAKGYDASKGFAYPSYAGKAALYRVAQVAKGGGRAPLVYVGEDFAELAGDEPAGEGGPDEAVMRIIRDILGRMTAKTQQAVKLRFEKGMMLHEIAEVQKCSKAMVGARINTALRHLRSCLELRDRGVLR